MARRNRNTAAPGASTPTTEAPAAPNAAPAEAEQQASEPQPGGFAGWHWALSLTFGLVVFDQLTKWLSVMFLAPAPAGEGRTIVLIPRVFLLRYAENTGAAFSLFTGKVGLLAIVSLLASVFIVWWWTRIPSQEKWGRVALTMILAGAVGNLIDRVRLGYVIDMFDAYIGSYDYPVFNVADALICVGVGVLLWRSWKGKV
ncbi:MAG: signal peptidase [Candidatus Sumerlaeota bacterium]|nr:signal peptidase [Candidatus Sumerlaeota bacterium]